MARRRRYSVSSISPRANRSSRSRSAWRGPRRTVARVSRRPGERWPAPSRRHQQDHDPGHHEEPPPASPPVHAVVLHEDHRFRAPASPQADAEQGLWPRPTAGNNCRAVAPAPADSTRRLRPLPRRAHVSAQITVNVAGSERSVPAQTTASDLFGEDRARARVNGELRDLAHVLADGDPSSRCASTRRRARGPAALDRPRAGPGGSGGTPAARLGIGPPVRDGFYYDFDVEDPFQPDDLKKLGEGHAAHHQRGQTFVRREISDEEALVELKDEPRELIGSARRGRRRCGRSLSRSVEPGSTIYDNVRQDGERPWGDLCRGPHIPSTKLIGNAFKLMRSAAAYWRNSEKNPQAPAHLRHGLADQGRAQGPPSGSPRPRSATTAGSARSSTCSASPTSSARARRVPPQGRHHQARWRTTSAGATSRRASSTSGRPTSPRTGCSTPPGTCPTTDTMFPAMEFEGTEYRPRDELPDAAQPHLPLQGPLLPRAAAAALRVRLGSTPRSRACARL